MQIIHRSLKWCAIAIGGCLLSSTIAAPARADLFSASLNSGDTLLTRDSRTGLEWLDLSASEGLTYRQVINGERNLTTQQGFRYATLDEIQDLLKSAETYTRSQPNFIPVTPTPGTLVNPDVYAASAIQKFLDVPLIDSYRGINIYAATPMFGPANPNNNRASVFSLSFYSGETISTFPFPLRPFADIVDIDTGEVFPGGPYVGQSSFLVRSTNSTTPPPQTTPEPAALFALLCTSGLAIASHKKRQSQLGQ